MSNTRRGWLALTLGAAALVVATAACGTSSAPGEAGSAAPAVCGACCRGGVGAFTRSPTQAITLTRTLITTTHGARYIGKYPPYPLGLAGSGHLHMQEPRAAPARVTVPNCLPHRSRSTGGSMQKTSDAIARGRRPTRET